MNRVAVLMSSYNGEKYIEEQIESILAQVGEFKLDLYVRDDGSVDNTHAVLEQYASQGKLTWYTGDNLRPAYSFMNLVMRCRGYDYYAFADQDDFWMPEKIERAIRKLSATEADYSCESGMPLLYISNVRLVDAKLKDLGRNAYREDPRTDFPTLSCAGGLLGCTMVFNEALTKLIQEKSAPEKMVMHDFYIALVCLACGGKILYEEEPSVKYRQHGKNVVGVSYSLVEKVKSRIDGIMRKSPVSIAEQAEEVLIRYKNQMSTDDRDWLRKVSHYRRNILTRIDMSASSKVRYVNRNMGFKNRMSILMGNR